MEDYIDLSTEEKLLAWWEGNCPRYDQSKTVGVVHVPGMSCEKCNLRDLAQIFGGSVPGNQTYISKQAAENIIKQNKKKTHIVPRNLLHYLIYQNEFEEEHVAHVSHVQTPGIIACGCVKSGEKNTLFCYLIDGSHRAVAAVRAGRTFEAYVLSLYETFRCVVGPKSVAATQRQ